MKNFTKITVLSAALCLLGCATVGPEVVSGSNFDAPSVDAGRQPFFPEAAMSARVQGFVIMTCDIALHRRLENCEVAFESTPGWGFGAAALRLATQMEVRKEFPVGISVIQPAFFCLDGAYCARARATVDAFKAEHQRRREENSGEPNSGG